MHSDSVASTQYISKLEGAYRDTGTLRLKLNKSLNNIRNAGFLAASYDSLSYESDTIKAWLYTGQQYRWGSLSINKADSMLLNSMGFSVPVNKYEVIDLKKFNAFRKQIVTFLENRGYPFARVDLENLPSWNTDTLTASFLIKQGNRYFIDSIMIKGNDPVSHKYLYPALGLYPGMAYNDEKIQKIPENIEKIPFLNQIRNFELEFSEDERVNVFLYLERASNNQADGLIGILPANQGQVKFTGQFDLRLSNLMKRGEELIINWKSLEEKSQELFLHIDYPYLLLQSFGISADLEIYKKDTSYLSRTLEAGIPFYINNQIQMKVFGDFESSSLIAKSAAAQNRYENFIKWHYGISYLYNNLDFPLNPSKGMKMEIFGSVGKKKEGSGNAGQTSAETGIDLSWFHRLFGSWVLHTSALGRYKYLEKKKAPTRFKENELYRFGGINALRGFDDNAFLAPIYSVVSLELRYLLSKNSNLYAFSDLGWYHKDSSSGIVEDFPWGFGLGAHIDSGNGIFYISYALGKQSDVPIYLESAKIHLGYISTF